MWAEPGFAPSRSATRRTRRSCSSWDSARSMLWWTEGSAGRSPDAGRFVIRYDHRDTGRSTTYEPGRPGYTGADLVADAVGVLDGYGLPAAHLVGVSAGGALAQLLALDVPGRVLSLALISTSPADPGDRDLPAAERRVRRVRPLGDGGLVGRRLGDRVPRRVRARAGWWRAAVRRGRRARSRPPGRRARRRRRGPPEPRPARRATTGREARCRRSGRRRSSFTAPPTRCSPFRTAGRWPARSRTHGCSCSTAPATASSEPTGTRSPRRSCRTPARGRDRTTVWLHAAVRPFPARRGPRSRVPAAPCDAWRREFEPEFGG